MLFLAGFHSRWMNDQVGLYSPCQFSCIEGMKTMGTDCRKVVGAGLAKRHKIIWISNMCPSSRNSSLSSQAAHTKFHQSKWRGYGSKEGQHFVFLAENSESLSRNQRSPIRHGIVCVAGPALTFSPPPKQKNENNEDDFFLNVGYAIRILREELPFLFYKELTFDIYRDDIVYQDPLMTVTGIKNYKLLFWALRFYGRIFFKSLWIEILRVWRPSEKVIMVRWTIRGIPRVLWEAHGQFDGTSEYRLDKHGKIYEHRVTNVLPNNPPLYEGLSFLDLVGAVSAQTNPSPNFIERIRFILSAMSPYLMKFSWVRYYCALQATLALSRNGDTFRSMVF